MAEFIHKKERGKYGMPFDNITSVIKNETCVCHNPGKGIMKKVLKQRPRSIPRLTFSNTKADRFLWKMQVEDRHG